VRRFLCSFNLHRRHAAATTEAGFARQRVGLRALQGFRTAPSACGSAVAMHDDADVAAAGLVRLSEEPAPSLAGLGDQRAEQEDRHEDAGQKLGMAIGRVVSIFADREKETATGYNWGGVGFEMVMAAALGSPFLAHLGG